jgi:hypothetical protein
MSQKFPRVVYRDVRGWKYIVDETISYRTTICDYARTIDYKDEVLARLCPSGELIVRPGYAWDGPSGPTIDTPDWMDASLVHDILYQFMRTGQLPNDDSYRSREKMRRKADDLMYKMLLEAGMPWLRALYSYYGVRFFAAWAASPNFPDSRV